MEVFFIIFICEFIQFCVKMIYFAMSMFITHNTKNTIKNFRKNST